jgi:hypothetical protein
MIILKCISEIYVMVRDDMDWINLAENRQQRRDLVNTVRNSLLS